VRLREIDDLFPGERWRLECGHAEYSRMGSYPAGIARC